MGQLLWVFDASKFLINLAPRSPNSDIYEFSWVRDRRSLWAINSGLALDFGNVILLIAEGHQRCKRIKSGGWGWVYSRKEFVDLLHKFTMLFTFDRSKPLWQSKKRGATTPLFKAVTKLVTQADSTIIESDALLELKKQLPNVNQSAIRGALASACLEAGYVKTSVPQQSRAWVKDI